MTPVSIEAGVDVKRSPEDVFDLCSDLSREPEWNPMMKRVVKLTDSPVGVGARYKTEFVDAPAQWDDGSHPGSWSGFRHGTPPGDSEGR